MKKVLTLIIFSVSLVISSCSSNKTNDSDTMDSDAMNTEAEGYNESAQDRTDVVDSMRMNETDTAVLVQDTIMNR